MNNQSLETLIREELARARANVRPADNMILPLAKQLAEAVEAEAARIGVNAVVAISDRAARPVLIHVMEDAYIASYDVALQKAYTVVALKMSTMDLKPLAQPGGSLYGIQFTNDGQIVIFGGGEPLKSGGRVIGGLGVSGGSEEQDAALAAYGAKVFAQLAEHA
ncbi:MAG: heme-binding protein [Clostridia bacterium]|nr:heme-binding protein [Clostridia bacterium]